MHWTLPELRALRTIEYDVLVEWLNEKQTPSPAAPELPVPDEEFPWA